MGEEMDRDVLLSLEAYKTWVRVFNKYGRDVSKNCRKRHLRRWGRLDMTQKETVAGLMNVWTKENPGEG